MKLGEKEEEKEERLGMVVVVLADLLTLLIFRLVFRLGDLVLFGVVRLEFFVDFLRLVVDSVLFELVLLLGCNDTFCSVQVGSTIDTGEEVVEFVSSTR